jgi:hypothetical protein
MTDVETTRDDALLAALWAKDEPPVRDPVFEMAAIAKVSRRRLLTEAAEWAALSVPVLVIAWAAWPTLVASAPQLAALVAAYGPISVCVGAIALVTWTTREVFAVDP